MRARGAETGAARPGSPRAAKARSGQGGPRTARSSSRDKLPTLSDVAAAARVSVPTASRVIGGYGYASEQARRQVLAAVRRLNYTPNRAARALRAAGRRALGVVVPDLGIPVYVAWLRAAGAVAGSHGYVLLICDAGRSPDTARSQLQWLLEERVAGVLLGGVTGAEPYLREFRKARIPVAPDLSPRRPALPLRNRPERAATLEAFRHLVSLGHRRIAYLCRDAGAPMTAMRTRLLDQAAAEAGFARPPGLTLELASGDACRAELLRLARRRDPPTAFVAGTSELTAPLLSGLGAAGLRIPHDVSVLAFGEGAWEEVFAPPISVVRHDYEGIATEVTEQLIARIEGRTPLPRVSEFPSVYVRRGSVAGARASRAGRAAVPPQD